MQFVEQMPWITRFNVQYLLGVDGISMPFILLNSLVTVLVVLAGWEVIEDKQAQYMGAFLIMSGLMNGIFSALDGVLFYVFFEASLIPMYIIIGAWGGPNRVYAAFKFFLYTLARLAADAGCPDLAVPRVGRQLQHPRLAPDADRPGAADPDLHRLPGVLRRQGPDVAGAYLVAGCPRRSAHRRLGGAGSHRAEARRLRLSSGSRCPSCRMPASTWRPSSSRCR
jgi:hypothetical protein